MTREGMARTALVSVTVCVLGGLILASVGSADDAPLVSVNPHAAMMGGAVSPHQGSGVPKPPHDMGSFSAGERREVQWKLPAAWSELSPTSMRLGNFLWTAPNGQKVEITVSALRGTAGGLAANFGMWRSQLGLAKLDDAEVMKESQKLTMGGHEMVAINLVSRENVLEGKFKASIYGAIYPRATDTWFFKAKGEEGAVTGVQEEFHRFLGSVTFLEEKKG